MYKACRSLELIHYTDYTTKFLTGDDIAPTLNRTDDDLHHIPCWLQVNRLTLNVNKSSFMVNGPQSVRTSPVLFNNWIRIIEQYVTKVYEAKFVAITIDGALTFKYNYESLITRLSMISDILHKFHRNVQNKYVENGLYVSWILYKYNRSYHMVKKQFDLYLKNSEISN